MKNPNNLEMSDVIIYIYIYASNIAEKNRELVLHYRLLT